MNIAFTEIKILMSTSENRGASDQDTLIEIIIFMSFIEAPVSTWMHSIGEAPHLNGSLKPKVTFSFQAMTLYARKLQVRPFERSGSYLQINFNGMHPQRIVHRNATLYPRCSK